MDLTRPVMYRGLNLNGATNAAPGEGLTGLMLTRVDWLPVGADGFTEKRSQGDGRDPSDIYLDGRRLVLDGVIHGITRGELYDLLQDTKGTFIPTASFTDEPGSYGYVPLSYEEPTEEIGDWPLGWRTLYVNVRPLQGISHTIVRDRTGGKAGRGGAISYRAVLDAIDPRVYASPAVFVDFDDDDTAEAGTLFNRGDYPAPLNVLLVVEPQAKPGFFTLTTGGAIMQIAIEQSASTQVYRYSGRLKVLTVETNGSGIDVLRMDLLTWLSEVEHPQVAPGGSAYSWTTVWSGGGTTYDTIPLATGSRIFYSESFA